MRKPSKKEASDMHKKLGARGAEGGSSLLPGSRFVLKAESFSGWMGRRLALEAKGHAKPVQMPKEKSNKIEFEDAKERIPVGRKNTSMDSRPKRLRTRGSQKRGAMRDQDV
jgi:hypothetical protein